MNVIKEHGSGTSNARDLALRVSADFAMAMGFAALEDARTRRGDVTVEEMAEVVADRFGSDTASAYVDWQRADG